MRTAVASACLAWLCRVTREFSITVIETFSLKIQSPERLSTEHVAAIKKIFWFSSIGFYSAHFISIDNILIRLSTVGKS
jgi:hypothetical protein